MPYMRGATENMTSKCAAYGNGIIKMRNTFRKITSLNHFCALAKKE